MRILDQIPEKNLMFVEHAFLDGKTYYEIYYCETKMFQGKGKFNEALSAWTNIVGNV